MILRCDCPNHELSIDERLPLVEDIWDSIAAAREAAPFTEAQREELDRRLDAYEENADKSMSCDEVEQRIEQIRKKAVMRT